MKIPPSLFPLFFIAMWIAVTYLLSIFGWNHLKYVYPIQSGFHGKRLGWVSGKVGWVSYRNAIIIDCNKEGIRLKTPLIFKLFHPQLFIPWKKVSLSQRKTLLGKMRYSLLVEEPLDVNLELDTSQTKQLKEFIERNQIPLKELSS